MPLLDEMGLTSVKLAFDKNPFSQSKFPIEFFSFAKPLTEKALRHFLLKKNSLGTKIAVHAFP